MPSIEMEFWLFPAVGLFTMFCLLKYIWNQWHNDVLFVCEDGSHDSGQQKKNPTGKVKVIRISTQTQVHTGLNTRYAEPQAHSKVILISTQTQGEHAQSAVQTGLNCPQNHKDLSYEDLDLDSIGKKLFDTFKNQRKPPRFKLGFAKNQFAVLFLSSSKDDLLNSIKGGTDKNIKVFPPDKLSNYVTARPHSGAHAEELIMEKFEKLVKAYDFDHKEPVQYIFLYTWLFPCTKCASAIIDTIIPTIRNAYPELLSDVAIVILYSGVHKKEKEDKPITEQKLWSHGINMWDLGYLKG